MTILDKQTIKTLKPLLAAVDAIDARLADLRKADADLVRSHADLSDRLARVEAARPTPDLSAEEQAAEQLLRDPAAPLAIFAKVRDAMTRNKAAQRAYGEEQVGPLRRAIKLAEDRRTKIAAEIATAEAERAEAWAALWTAAHAALLDAYEAATTRLIDDVLNPLIAAERYARHGRSIQSLATIEHRHAATSPVTGKVDIGTR